MRENPDFGQNFTKNLILGPIARKNLGVGRNFQKSGFWSNFSTNLNFG